MKTILNTILSTSIILSLINCSEDDITVKPEGSIPNDILWQTANDVQLALAGCYDGLQLDYLYANRNQNDATLRERECFTDNAMNGYLYQRFNNIKNGSLTPSDEIPILRPWESLYKVIRRANSLIENIDRVPDHEVSQENKAIYAGEAKVIRALMYYELLVGWDEVPLILTTLTSDEGKIQTKSSATEVYNQIIKDLEEAASILPDTSSLFGRMTKGAANSLLARAYLYGYGYLNQSNALALAAEKSKLVINGGQYSLYDDYSSLFTPENETSSEIIMSVRFTPDLGGNNGEGFSHSFNAMAQPNNQPLPNFANDFYCTDGLPIDESPLFNAKKEHLNRDPRWDANLIYNGEKWLENRGKFNIKPVARRTGYAIDKYIISNNAGILANNGGQDWYIIRYADVLLMRAEALIEQGNTSQEVYDLINEVRQRVEMPKIEDVEGTGLSQSDLRDILRHERRVELAFEGIRFQDLKRWGTMSDAYTNSSNDKKVGTNATIIPVSYQDTRSIVLPIPQSEIDQISTLEQNPAW